VPLSHTFDSPESLARAVLDAVERKDLQALQSLPLSEDEFRDYMWPELPASRTKGFMPFEFVWGQLAARSDTFLRQTLGRYGGRRLELLAVDFDGETTTYPTFIVKRESRLRVRDEHGQEDRIRMFGSVLVQDGRCKLFSFVSD
jgi:hypothetical protein